MARPFDHLRELGIEEKKGIFKIGVRIVDIWRVVNKIGQEHLELVFIDKQGDTIQAIVPFADVEALKPILKEKMTYVVQNFVPRPNDIQYKVVDHPHKIILDSGVSLRQKDIQDIPNKWFNFKDFKSILNGKVRPDHLVDVIGGVHEITYLKPGGNKPKASFKMQDQSGELLNCNLWDDSATKFISYYSNKSGCDSIVIILTHAKIADPQGSYTFSVSNWWHGSKLFINDDIEEIQNFKKIVPKLDIIESSSQSVSQFTGLTQSSQGGDEYKFMKDAQVLTLAQINTLDKPITCVTVATTGKIEPSGNGWSYEGCTICTKKVTKSSDNENYFCKDGHMSKAPKRRYKVEITVLDSNNRSKFIFWDNDCTKTLGLNADELMKKMFDEGEEDEKAFPLDLDFMLGKTAAFRVNVQPRWKESSVNWMWTELELINKLREQLEPQEQTSKLRIHNGVVPTTANGVVPTTAEGNVRAEILETKQLELKETSMTAIKQNSTEPANEEIHFQTQDLSATADYDPATCITPLKRRASEAIADAQHTQDIGSTQLSTTKTTKQIKKEGN